MGKHLSLALALGAIGVLLAGCVDNGTSAAVPGIAEARPSELSDAEIEPSNTVAMDGCRGTAPQARGAAQLHPWQPPPGWEPGLLNWADYKLYAITCDTVDFRGVATLHHVSFVIEAHNYVDPPDGAIDGGYTALFVALSVWSSDPALGEFLFGANSKPLSSVELSSLASGIVYANAAAGSLRVVNDVIDSSERSLGEGENLVVLSTDPVRYMRLHFSLDAAGYRLDSMMSFDGDFEGGKWPLTTPMGAPALANLYVGGTIRMEMFG